MECDQWIQNQSFADSQIGCLAPKFPKHFVASQKEILEEFWNTKRRMYSNQRESSRLLVESSSHLHDTRNFYTEKAANSHLSCVVSITHSRNLLPIWRPWVYRSTYIFWRSQVKHSTGGRSKFELYSQLIHNNICYLDVCQFCGKSSRPDVSRETGVIWRVTDCFKQYTRQVKYTHKIVL